MAITITISIIVVTILLFGINKMWSDFAEELIEENHESIKEIIDDYYERSLDLAKTCDSLRCKLHDDYGLSWEEIEKIYKEKEKENVNED